MPKAHSRVVYQGPYAVIPKGPYPIGDNDWPTSARHTVALRRPLGVACLPVTVKEFTALFVDSREYWNDAWWPPECQERVDGADALYRRLRYRRERLEEPVHVNFFEAVACARFFGARLLREKEWEVAAMEWLAPKRRPRFDHQQAARARHTVFAARAALTPQDFSRWGCVFGLCPEWCADAYDPLAYYHPLPTPVAHPPQTGAATQCYRGTVRRAVPLAPDWVCRRRFASPTRTAGIGFRLCWDL